jgi:hypothetical protein
MQSRLWFILLVAIGVVFSGATVASPPLPSGERHLGQTVIEPGYDDRTGNLIYLMTPIGAPSPPHADPRAISPLYIIVYPDSAANIVGTMNCAHNGGDNCPDHGPGISELAQAVVPDVYDNGVWGHDHIMNGPGGSEFNVTWHVAFSKVTSVQRVNTVGGTAPKTGCTPSAAGTSVRIPYSADYYFWTERSYYDKVS